MQPKIWAAAVAVALLVCARAQGQPTIAANTAAITSPTTTDTTASSPQSITMRGRCNNAVGSADAASQGVIGSALLKSRPALHPDEVLEFVPCVIVTQPSGDSKANQYFLRGFNLYHGTDFATSVNGMPANTPSHSHGQVYTDLNFSLPELVQRIKYREAPCFAKSRDFASAGAADISYRTRLDEHFGQVSLDEMATGVAWPGLP